MNHIFFRTLLGSVAIIASAPHLVAQSAPTGIPGPGGKPAETRGELSPLPPPLLGPAAERTSMTLQLKGGDMGTAIEQIESAFEKSSKMPMNVLLTSDVKEIKVPALTLRKVSWADALNLVAVSAGCSLEPIKGEQGGVIGYRVLSAAPLAGPAIEGAGLVSDIGKLVTENSEAQPGIGGVISFKPASNTSSNVRVYGLGEITTVIKFNEVLQSLEEVLKTSGLPPDSMKVAVHEKTNVLVITGEPRVHELVGQLIQALEKNVASAQLQRSRGEDMKRQMIEAEMRLQAQGNEKDRLEKRLNEAEAEMTKMRRELDRSRAGELSKP